MSQDNFSKSKDFVSQDENAQAKCSTGVSNHDHHSVLCRTLSSVFV